MAEGGGNDDADNPFSFKKFVKGKGKGSSRRDDDSSTRRTNPDLCNVPDVSSSQGQGGASRPVAPAAAAAEEPRPAKKEKDENPFSFTKFLQSQGCGARPKVTHGHLSTLDLANDLPDFVQDSPGNRSRKPPRADVSLPDFAIDSEPLNLPNPPDNSREVPNPADLDHVLQHDLVNGTLHNESDAPELVAEGAVGTSDPLFINRPQDDPVLDSCDNDNDSPCISSRSYPGSGLPDFLPDSAIGQHSFISGHNQSPPDLPLDLDHNLAPHPENGATSEELQRLQEENRELQRQLDQARADAAREAQRVDKAMKEIEKSRKQEAEETAALEQMVHQVEQNLQSTLERAVTAESTITKLKQEMKALQGQMTSLQAENEALRAGRTHNDPVQEKARYASNELAAAAKTAEISLKDLLKGVDKLKLISEVLASIDKITEEKEDSETQKPKEGPS